MVDDSDDDSDEEDDADSKDSKKTSTKDKDKEEKDDEDKKKKKEDNDKKKEKGEKADEDDEEEEGNGVKGKKQDNKSDDKEEKGVKRALNDQLFLNDQVASAKKLLQKKKWDKLNTVNSMLAKKFLLSGRVDGMARKLKNDELIEETLGRKPSNNRILTSSSEALSEMDKNRPILAVSYSELRNLQSMEHSLKRRTKELLITLAKFPKDGVQVRTKILKIYENGKQRRLVNGDSKDIKFVYLDQAEFTFSGKNKFKSNGFNKINLSDEKISKLSTRTYLKGKLMSYETKTMETARK